MLTDISGSNLKPLDGFYNELRRKYPNTFTLATDLGKGDRVIQRLPRLDNEVHQTPVGVTPNAPNPVPPQIWTPNSFLYKVQSQKSRYGQRKEAETSHPGSGSLIIQDKTVSLPTLNRREYLGAQSRGSFRLPSLRTQVEQNQAELKSKLNTTRCEDVPKTDQNSSSRLKVNAKTEEPTSSTKTISKKGNLGGQPRPSVVKSDPMGTIMKELLPNKPGRIINDLSKSSKNANYNNGSLSDSDSGMSRCAPLKIFRPKSRSPHGAPTPGDIIKKFSAKPTMAHGPVRANHGVIPVTRIEVRNNSENFEMGESRKRDPINGNEKPQQKSPVARVRFEDESEHEAESRYKERSLQERNETSRNVVKGVASVPTQFQESVTKAVSSQVPSQSERYETQPITGQQGVTVPYRRQPFPPAVAKKVLIDIPTSGHHFKRPLHCEMSSVGTSRMDKPFSLRPRNETASLEGINVSFGQWKGQENMVSRKTKDYRLNQSTSSMETIESGITDVSSEASIMRMEWAGSGSSIGSGKHARSSVENLDSKSALQTSDNSLKSKGSGEISFYSKVKRSLNIRMRLNPDSKKLSGSSQSEGSDFLDLNSQHNGHLESDHGSQHSITDNSAALLKPTSPVSKHGKMADYTNKQKKKNETTVKANKPATDPSTPIKASFFNMKRTPSFLKKGRAKDYMVHIPTPPSWDLRLSSQRPRNASTNNIKTQSEHDKLPNLEPARLLGIHSDSSRVVELQRPKNGFLGLYLAKKSHDRHSGLFVVQMSSAFSSAFPQGILQVGDEVLEINRRRARDLSMVEINSLLEESSCVLLHVLPAGDRR